mgnify:FL=1
MTTFVIFILLLSFMSFAVAFLAYGVCLRYFPQSTAAKVILTPLCVVGWDFLVITRNDSSRLFLGALPLVAVAGIVLYVKWKNRAQAPTPLELAKKQKSKKKKK